MTVGSHFDHSRKAFVVGPFYGFPCFGSYIIERMSIHLLPGNIVGECTGGFKTPGYGLSVDHPALVDDQARGHVKFTESQVDKRPTGQCSSRSGSEIDSAPAAMQRS